MGNRTVISIPIDDRQFKAFLDLFNTFQDKLKDLPEDWNKVNDVAGDAQAAMAASVVTLVESMGHASGHARDLAKQLKDAASAQKDFGSATVGSETGLKKMAKEAKSLNESIFGIGKYLFKIGAMGLGAAGGLLWGADALANAAVGNQRQARSLGLTTGQMKAFDQDIAPRGYATESQLQHISDAKQDMTGRVMLARATGLSPAQVQSMDAGSLSLQIAQRIHNSHEDIAIASQMPWFSSLGYDKSSMNLLRAANQGELDTAKTNYAKDSATFQVSDKQIDAVYSFANALTRAKNDIETNFTKKLAELNQGGAIDKFTKAMTDDANKLINGFLTDANIKTLTDGLNDLTSGVLKAAKMFGYLPDINTIVNDNPIHRAVTAVNDWVKTHGTNFGIGGVIASAAANFIDPGHKADFSDVTSAAPGSVRAGGKTSKTDKQKMLALMAKMDIAKGLPAGFVEAIAKRENPWFDPHRASSTGAMGIMQLEPATAKTLGVTDSQDWMQNIMGGATLLAQLNKKYKGDLRKVAAAYNWTPNLLDRDIAKYGKDWEAHIVNKRDPGETKAYIDAVMNNLKNWKPEVKVTVTAPTGTNVAVSTNAAGK